MPVARSRPSQPAKLDLSPADILAVRSNPVLRDDFLARLAQECMPQIAAIVKRALHKDNGYVDGEARQAFMLAASDALDTARLEDDGRGKNDPVKWATWRGLNAVRDWLRDVHCRRNGQPSPRQAFEQGLVYQSDLESEGGPRGQFRDGARTESFDNILANEGHYRHETAEEEAMVDLLLDELMETLTDQERPVAELLVHGRTSTGEIEITCVCPKDGGRHCVTNDIAHALGHNPQAVNRIVKRIRAKATTVFGVEQVA